MGTFTAGPGSPLTGSSANGGKVYGFNNISNVAPLVVLNANQARQSVTFHNPGSQDIFIAPVLLQGALGAAPAQPTDTAFTPTTGALGGTFRVYANGGTLTITGECQHAFQALAASGTTNPLTVMESNC